MNDIIIILVLSRGLSFPNPKEEAVVFIPSFAPSSQPLDPVFDWFTLVFALPIQFHVDCLKVPCLRDYGSVSVSVCVKQDVMLRFEVEVASAPAFVPLLVGRLTYSRIEKHSPLLHLRTLTGGF